MRFLCHRLLLRLTFIIPPWFFRRLFFQTVKEPVYDNKQHSANMPTPTRPTHHGQQFLIGIDFILLFAREDKRHRHRDGVRYHSDGECI